MSTLIVTIADNAVRVGEDVVAATAIACRALPQAAIAEQQQVRSGRLPPDQQSIPWYRALCDNLTAHNPNLNVNSPVWVATGLTRITNARD